MGRGSGERERNIYQVPPIHTPTGDLTHNLSMCPDLGTNPHSFGEHSSQLSHPARAALSVFDAFKKIYL